MNQPKPLGTIGKDATRTAPYNAPDMEVVYGSIVSQSTATPGPASGITYGVRIPTPSGFVTQTGHKPPDAKRWASYINTIPLPLGQEVVVRVYERSRWIVDFPTEQFETEECTQ